MPPNLLTASKLGTKARFCCGKVHAALQAARRYEEAVDAVTEVILLDPGYKPAHAHFGVAYYWLRDLEHARSACETMPDHWQSQQCLEMIYDKLGRHAEAEAVLSKMKAEDG